VNPHQRAAAVLRALADMAPANEPKATGRTIPLEWFRWLPASAVRMLSVSVLGLEPNALNINVPLDRRFGERLAAVDQIRSSRNNLRVGWLFVCGRAQDGTRVFQPLVTAPVRVERTPTAARLVLAGDVEVTSLVKDGASRYDLERRIEFGGGGLDDTTSEAVPLPLLARMDRLRRFAIDTSKAAGVEAVTLVSGGEDPDALMAADHLSVAAGIAVYAVRDTKTSSRASSLRALADGLTTTWTAFHSIYVGAPEPTPKTPDADSHGTVPISSPYLLTPVQQQALMDARTEPVTVISGAPGTGKSHTVVAIACDALARGQSVLVAAKTNAAVDALIDRLEGAPGPDPVVFGSSERRHALAQMLAAGQMKPVSDVEVAAQYDRKRHTAETRDGLLRSIEARLAVEQDGDVSAREVCPGLFEPDADIDAAARLARDLRHRSSGWSGRRRRRALERITWALPGSTLDEIDAAIAIARAANRQGLEIGLDWDSLLDWDERARQETAQWLAQVCRSSARINRSTLPAVAALATALRSGRAARREQLRRIDGAHLARALPLWVGTLADIDDLLPPEPAFDLVILDEASSIEQPLAASALLRGKRAVIVGDPHQLRHVSFLGDADIARAVRQNVLVEGGGEADPALCAQLDVRRNSAFDTAAAVAPVLTLDEHFRSNPHLVEWVARTLYSGTIHVATRSPRTECIDCVDVVHTTGHRDKAGVVQGEIGVVIDNLRRLRQQGARSVGVVTPFRAQAEALEAAVLAAFHADDLTFMDLRVGTVHGMQGNERDVIVASIGIGPEDTSSWPFVEDPHLFTVLVTRARDHMVLVLSADPPPTGLFAQYLAQADDPPGPPPPAGPVDPWAEAIAHDLETAGLPVRTAYPTGRHVVDVCVGDSRRAVSVECCIHPGGPASHVRRHLALRRTGWDVVEAYPSKWGGRRAELAIELIRGLKP
jgi:hypothetical protein